MSDDESSPIPSTSRISPIQVKIPPFWPKNVSLWFHQIECQFSLHGISKEKTKYNYVMSSLDNEVASLLSDIITKPLSTTPYSDLKERICLEYEVSEHAKLKQLTTGVCLGDKKPSTLLREMRTLAGTQVNDNFLKVLFMQHLPNHIRTALVASQIDSLNDLAKLGDQLADLSTDVHQIYAQEAIAKPNDRIAILEEKISELTHSIDGLIKTNRQKLPTDQKHKYYPKGRNEQNELCWYHYKFGKKAKNCIQPCLFSSNSNLQQENFLPRH